MIPLRPVGSGLRSDPGQPAVAEPSAGQRLRHGDSAWRSRSYRLSPDGGRGDLCQTSSTSRQGFTSSDGRFVGAASTAARCCSALALSRRARYQRARRDKRLRSLGLGHRDPPPRARCDVDTTTPLLADSWPPISGNGGPKMLTSYRSHPQTAISETLSTLVNSDREQADRDPEEGAIGASFPGVFAKRSHHTMQALVSRSHHFAAGY
jgi:hypothetical protein